MTRKNQATGTIVDWTKVDQATEKKRTYEIELFSGGIIFKYYKPSEMKAVLNERAKNPKHRANSWKKAKQVGRLA